MTKLKLLVKASGGGQLKLVEDQLRNEFANLDVELTVLGSPNKWVQVSLSGEDEVIAINYIKQHFGTCPVNLKSVNMPAVLKGYISKIDSAKQELRVDVGIFEPQSIQATVSLITLQKQLVSGKNVSLQRISELFGFHENLPLSMQVFEGMENLRSELAAEQLERFRIWQQSLLDRLIVLGASKSQIEVVLERTRLNRDIILVEEFGMFEHALTCKLGTAAAGLIPRIGGYMKNSEFVVFNPKKLAGFIGEPVLLP